jgi:hypothetical protein
MLFILAFFNTNFLKQLKRGKMTRKGIDTSNFGFAQKYLLSWARGNNNLLTLLFIVLHIYSLFKVSIVIKLILLRIWFNLLIDMALLPFSALVRLIVTKKRQLVYFSAHCVYIFFSQAHALCMCTKFPLGAHSDADGNT